MLTERKAIDHLRRELAEKRGGGNILGESAILERAGASPEPNPAFAAQVAEDFHLRLEQLADDVLVDIAIAKMEGYSNKEIADRFGVTVRTIERKLNLIREIWSQEVED